MIKNCTISRVKKQNRTNLGTFDNPRGFVQTAYTVAYGHAPRKGSTTHRTSVAITTTENREVKIPRFRFTGTGDIHVPVPVNRGTTCNLRNPRYFGVSKPIREWQLSLLRFAIDC